MFFARTRHDGTMTEKSCRRALGFLLQSQSLSHTFQCLHIEFRFLVTGFPQGAQQANLVIQQHGSPQISRHRGRHRPKCMTDITVCDETREARRFRNFLQKVKTAENSRFATLFRTLAGSQQFGTRDIKRHARKRCTENIDRAVDIAAHYCLHIL